jgi:hypothetical protein
MQITKEFLQAEIRSLEQEMGKANTFLVQAQATIAAYSMLINRLDAPEEEVPTLTVPELEAAINAANEQGA